MHESMSHKTYSSGISSLITDSAKWIVKRRSEGIIVYSDMEEELMSATKDGKSNPLCA